MDEQRQILDEPEQTTIQEIRSPLHKILRIAFLISFVIFLSGFYLKNNSIKLGTEIFITGCLLISLTGILRNLLRPNKKAEQYFLALTFLFLPVGFLFNQLNWKWGHEIFLAGKVIFLTWLLVFIYLYVIRKK